MARPHEGDRTAAEDFVAGEERGRGLVERRLARGLVGEGQVKESDLKIELVDREESESESEQRR